MSFEWQRNKDMPDFTRTGQDGASASRLGWLVVVLAILGGAVLISFLGSASAPVDPSAEAAPAATTSTDG